MELIIQIIQYFFLSLVIGMSFFSLLANTKLTGVGLYKLILGIMAGLLVICFVMNFFFQEKDNWLLFFYIFGFIILYLLFNFHQNERSSLDWMLYIVKIFSFLGASFFLLEMEWGIFFYHLLGALYMGGIMYMMLLGHWYLLTPKLTEQPLLLGIKLVWLVMSCKILITLWGCIQHGEFLFLETTFGVSYSFNWMVFIMRILWGYFVIGILSYFCWKLVKIRSLQSATGVLYVMTFSMFIGEIMSVFLLYKYGVKI